MTATIRTIAQETAADAVRIEDADIPAGLARLRELGLDPDPLAFTQAVISAFILAALADDPKNVHEFVDHSIHGRTLDKAVTLAQSEEARLDDAVAVLAASAAEVAA